MIGVELGGVYDNMPQILNVPRDGFIKSWHVVSHVIIEVISHVINHMIT